MNRALGGLMLVVGLGLLGLAGWFLAVEDLPESPPPWRPPFGDPRPEGRAEEPEGREAITTSRFRQGEAELTHEGLQIVDAAGRPLAGVQVGSFSPEWRRRSEGRLTPEAWRLNAEEWRRSDAEGLVDTRGLEPSRHLIARHEGLAGWISMAEVEAAPATRLRLRQPAVLAVQVVADGAPQPGYRVMAIASRREGPQTSRHASLVQSWIAALEQDGLKTSWPTAARSAKTDREGVAHIALDPLDRAMSRALTYTLAVQGFRIVEATVDWKPGPRLEARLDVPPVKTFAFRLVDAAGQPRPIDWPLSLEWTTGKETWEDGISLEKGRGWWRPDLSPTRFRAQAVTYMGPLNPEATLGGEDFHGLSDKDRIKHYLDLCRRHGFVLNGWPLEFPWDPAGRKDPESRWRLGSQDRDAVIDVICDAPPIAHLPLRLADGTPLPGEQLTIIEGERRGTVWLHSNGEIRFATGRRRQFRIEPANASKQLFLPFEVDVPALGKDGRLEPIFLPDLHHYTWGRVVDPSGQPVFGAEVQVLGPGGTRTVKSGAGGRYLVRGREEPTGRLRVGAHVGLWRQTPWHDVPADSEAPDLVLPDSGGLEIQLVMPDAAPPVSVRIEHHTEGTIDHPWASGREVVASGRIVTGPIPVGLVDVEVSLPGGPRKRVDGVTIVLGETTRDPRLLKLGLDPHLEELAFEVLHHDGQPAARVFALLGIQGPTARRARLLEQEVDEAGRVAFQVPPQTKSVLVLEGLEGGQHVVPRPRHGQKIVLPRSCRLRVNAPVVMPAGVTLCLHATAGEVPESLREIIVPSEVILGTAKAPADAVLVHPGSYRAELLRRRASGGERRLPLGTLTVPSLAEATVSLPGDEAALTAWLKGK